MLYTASVQLDVRSSRAYARGRAAFARSPDPEDNSNPYATWDHRHEQWECGWVDAEQENTLDHQN